MTDEECSRWNTSWLTEAAKAFMSAAYLGQRGDKRALNFLELAENCGTAEELAYARHLEAALTFTLLHDHEEAIRIGKEVVGLARNLGDRELEGDALKGISMIYESLGDAKAKEMYEREFAKVREER
jgi:tetratricopeptide (TPR) repeat protein